MISLHIHTHSWILYYLYIYKLQGESERIGGSVWFKRLLLLLLQLGLSNTMDLGNSCSNGGDSSGNSSIFHFNISSSSSISYSCSGRNGISDCSCFNSSLAALLSFSCLSCKTSISVSNYTPLPCSDSLLILSSSSPWRKRQPVVNPFELLFCLFLLPFWKHFYFFSVGSRV